MEIVKRISLISFCIFIFWIPFGQTWANIFLYITIALTFIDKDLYNNFSFIRLCKEEKYFIFISSLYVIWCVLSLIWSNDISRGFQFVGRYILIIVFPWIICLMKTAGIIKNLKYLFYVFCLGCFIASIVCFIISYQNCWQETENGLVFSSTVLKFGWPAKNAFETISLGYNNFAYFFLSHFMHPSYYSLMYLILIIFLLNEYPNFRENKYKVLTIAVSAYFAIFLFLLQSRGNFLATMAVVFSFVVFKMFEKKKIVITFILFVFCTFLSFILIKNSRLSLIVSSIEDVLNSKNSEERNKKIENNINDRFFIWYNAFQVIKEHPILGVGIGDTDNELENQYKKNGVDFTFGTHNQYIYAQLSMGILGLLLLLAMLLVPLYFGIKNRYFPLIGFAIAVMVNLMFENMLTRNAGLMFIPWAMMLLLMMSEEKKNELAK